MSSKLFTRLRSRFSRRRAVSRLSRAIPKKAARYFVGLMQKILRLLSQRICHREQGLALCQRLSICRPILR
jgi:hypothetical protein